MNYTEIRNKKYIKARTTMYVEIEDLQDMLDRFNEGLVSADGKRTLPETVGKSLILQPDYQREKEWTREQEIAYMEFILKGGTSGLDLYFNNPTHQTTYTEPYECVDGLQRITAVTRFFNNEYSILEGQYYAKDIEGFTDVSFALHIGDLRTRREVLEWYLQLNTGGTPHSEEEIERVKRLLAEEVR